MKVKLSEEDIWFPTVPGTRHAYSDFFSMLIAKRCPKKEKEEEEVCHISLGDLVTVEGLSGDIIVSSIWQTSSK